MNVPTMTIGPGVKPEDTVELEKLRVENNDLRAENKELKMNLREAIAKCENLEKKCAEMEHINQLTYLRGRCDGLEFSISHKWPGAVATA